MKYLLFLIIVALIFLAFLFRTPVSEEQSLEEVSENTVEKVWETRVNEQAGVTVEVTPLALGSQVPEWKFNIVMDTHLVELDHNLSEIVLLVDDQGKEYRPIALQGTGDGGHHRDDTLIFNAIVPIPEEIELKIRDLGDSSVRSFVWKLNL